MAPEPANTTTSSRVELQGPSTIVQILAVESWDLQKEDTYSTKEKKKIK